jgi:hypothetical protein
VYLLINIPKEIRKKTRICNPDIFSLSLYYFISDEWKITTDIIRVRGYVTMFILYRSTLIKHAMAAPSKQSSLDSFFKKQRIDSDAGN